MLELPEHLQVALVEIVEDQVAELLGIQPLVHLILKNLEVVEVYLVKEMLEGIIYKKLAEITVKQVLVAEELDK